MRADLLAAVDAGTSTTRACVFTMAGERLAEAAVPVALEHPAPGWAEQPSELLIESTCESLHAVADRVDARRVAAIGLTGQMGGLILVDEDGRSVSPHLSWLDARAGPAVDRAMERDGRRIISLGGLPPYLAPKAAWWRDEHPEEYSRARRMVMAAGYIALRLSGRHAGGAVVDRPSSGFVGLYDVRTGELAPELCELWGVPGDLAPRVVRAGEIVGELSTEAATRTGFRQGTPLVAGPGDGPCGWLGIGAVAPGIIVDTSGTSDHLGTCGRRFAPDLEHGVLISLPSAVEGHWHLQGYTSGTGLTHRWYLRTFPPGRQAGDGIAELERLAEQVPPGSEGLVCIPHFAGRVCPYQPAVSGVWFGITWRHRYEHLYRSLLESVAYEYACYFRAAARVDPDFAPTEVRVIGGGGASRLWAKIKADVLGVPFVIPEESNYTCWGAALAAAAGMGLVDDLSERAQATLRVQEVIEPDAAAGEPYRAMVDLYESLYVALEGPFRTLWRRRQGA